MKLLIASDIHGSAYYCQALMHQLAIEKADTLLLLGDLLYHGPRNDLPKNYHPKEVITLLNNCPSRILCVRGNCDSEVDQMVLSFSILSDYAFLYLTKRQVFITHGHLFNLNHLPPSLKKGDILLHGHTHVPAWKSFGDDNLYINPGSISIPKEESPHSYLLLEDHNLTWKTLEGKPYHQLCL
ncbi:phosphodiesterase [Megasphaera sp. UPII 135-E]|uniref:phosphodiesterase n=1 Tax=Megasphaera sp. UPII 135-E TaxID=1000569 RepID=UPI00021A2B36|nr:phosphodiesterase [Megasphaera sp. UPII 135-E]EGS35740.1 phosphodiesterase family protein [Megasphaera sp. UPII 135-E]